MDSKKRQLRGILFAIVTALFWGVLAIGLKVAAEFIDSISIVWFRFFISFSFLASFYAFRKPKALRIIYSAPPILYLAAVFLGLNYLGFMNGIRHTDPNTAQIIIQMGPILLGLMGFVLFKEKINLRQGFGFLVAGVGLVIFYRQSLLSLVEERTLFNQGVWWIVVAALAWMLYALIQKRLVARIPSQELNLVIFGLPMLAFLPGVQWDALAGLETWQWWLMIFLGLNTLIGYGSLAYAIELTDINKVSVIITMNPMLTILLMAAISIWEVSWMEGRVLDTVSALAALMVIAGGVVAVVFRKGRFVEPEAD